MARATRLCMLEGYRSLIGSWFSEYPSLKAHQVHNMLKERGVEVSYPLVVKYTRSFRRKKDKVYHPLTFLPGEEAQVDWCFSKHPARGKLCCFVFILSYSRYLFAQVFPRSSFEFFIEGRLMAFSSINGAPHSLRFDNLSTVVLKRRPEIQCNPRFLEFCRHYNIQIRLCNPGAGNEKGRVERAIRTLKESFFNKADNCQSLKALNNALHKCVDHKNHTLHRATQQMPAELLKEEKLKALPAIPYNNEAIHPPVQTTKTGLRTFDTNLYSVPEYLVGKSRSIHSRPEMIKIYEADKEVASHPRVFQRHKQIINPLHRSYSKLSEKAKMQRIYEVIMETEYRRQHKIKRLLRLSGIKKVKTFAQFDWNFNPKISQEDIMSFVNEPWIDKAFNLGLIGAPGLGNSHIASATCYEALLQGPQTTCITAFDLTSKIPQALNPASRTDYYAKVRVLCIDELGYTYHKKEDTDVLFQVLSKRSEMLPTIITTNLPPKEWGSIFSGAAASAILDRLSFNGRFVTFEGRSYRLLKKHKSK